MRIIAPFGFYGWGNIGDEATLQGFARLSAAYPRRLRVAVASRNPEHCRRVEPSFTYFRAQGRDRWRWWIRRTSNAAVIAGGTPIMDGLGDWPLCELVPIVDMARRFGPVAFVGAGVESLHRAASRELVAHQLAPLVCHWSVRSGRDCKRLLEYGVREESVTVAADMAWLLPTAGNDFGRQKLTEWGFDPGARIVAVNVCNEAVVEQTDPQCFAKLAKFLDELVEGHGARVLFLSNEVRLDDSFDTAAARRVLAAMRHADRCFVAPNEYWAPQQMQSLVGECWLAVSMRYHFCVFAALQGVPFLAITRSDKVADLCWDLEWPYHVGIAGIAELPNVFGTLTVGWEAAEANLRRQSDEYRLRAARNQRALDSVCSPPSQGIVRHAASSVIH